MRFWGRKGATIKVLKVMPEAVSVLVFLFLDFFSESRAESKLVEFHRNELLQ